MDVHAMAPGVVKLLEFYKAKHLHRSHERTFRAAKVGNLSLAIVQKGKRIETEQVLGVGGGINLVLASAADNGRGEVLGDVPDGVPHLGKKRISLRMGNREGEVRVEEGEGSGDEPPQT